VKKFCQLKSDHRGHQTIIKHYEIMNYLENQVDDHNQRTIGSLVNHSTDPVEIIKRKEVYENFESVADRCEDVADVLATIIAKNQ